MKRCMLINTTSILPKDINTLHLQFKSLSRHQNVFEDPLSPSRSAGILRYLGPHPQTFLILQTRTESSAQCAGSMP